VRELLGIVAEKFGAKKVTGIEIDDWVVDNANDNVAINHCEVTEMLLGTSETLDGYTNDYFDVILANIHREVILNDLNAYLRVLKPNGLIIISGLQTIDLQLVNSVCLEKSLEKIAENTRNEWGVLGYLKK